MVDKSEKRRIGQHDCLITVSTKKERLGQKVSITFKRRSFSVSKTTRLLENQDPREALPELFQQLKDAVRNAFSGSNVDTRPILDFISDFHKTV